MSKKEKTNPKSWHTKGLLSVQRRQRVNLRQPQTQQHSPARPPTAQQEAKAGPAPSSCKQVPAAGAQSRGSAPHSPCHPPGSSPTPLAAHAPGGQRAGAVLAAPETTDGALPKEQGERAPSRPQELRHEEDHSEQELSEGGLSRHPELSQGGDSSDQRSPHESWDRITIRTVWVNPRYAELLRNRHVASQDGAEAAPDSCEHVPAAGSQSQVSVLHGSYCSSSCSSSCSSRSLSSSSSTLLSVQTPSEQQDVRQLQPSRSREGLQTLRRMFWCSCVTAQPED